MNTLSILSCKKDYIFSIAKADPGTDENFYSTLPIYLLNSIY